MCVLQMGRPDYGKARGLEDWSDGMCAKGMAWNWARESTSKMLVKRIHNKVLMSLDSNDAGSG
jgi:hypothetical protein